MPIERRSTTPIRFGPFEVDPASGELRKHGVRVKLQEQPFQILEFLLEHRGRVVTREELRLRLWPADTFVDFDHGLYNAIKRLREVLGDVADTPRFIETVPKRGYRFIGDVTEIPQLAAQGETGEAVVGEVPPSATLPPTPPRSEKKPLRGLVGAGGLALILFLLVGLNVRDAGGGIRVPVANTPQIHSLAVLPLKNLSDDPAQEYFSFGMTEELITDLAQISGLRVISHTSVLQYEKGTKSLPQIAGELGVDGIVEGSVQRSGDRVRITAQLIYAPQDQHLWAESYDSDVRDSLALQTTVAVAIVESIRPRTALNAPIPPKTAASPSLQAMDDYLQCNYSIQRMASGEGVKGFEAAIQCFKKVISEAPDFAPAYLGLANMYEANYDWRPNQITPLERIALAKALELDPRLAVAHVLNARIHVEYDCDLPGAETELRTALSLNPNLAEARGLYSSYLQNVGRTQEGLGEAQRALDLDPAFRDYQPDALETFMMNGEYDRVIEFQRQHLEMIPNDGFAYIDGAGLIDAYHFAGRYQESIEALQQAWNLFGFKEIGQGVAKAYATSGYSGALRYSARQMERLYVEGKVWKPDMIAHWYVRAGDKDQALKWIRITLADNNHCWLGLDRDPNFFPLHSDPRFQELVESSVPPAARAAR